MTGILTGIPVFNGFAPAESPKVCRLELTPAPGRPFAKDFLIEEANGIIQFVQSIYVDNSLNSQEIVIAFGGSQQILRIPGETQGIYPCYLPNQSLLIATASAEITVPVFLCNFPQPYQVWGAGAGGGGGGSVIENAAWVDHNGVIAAGGVSQTAIPANATRKRLMIINPFAAATSLFINFTDPATDNSATADSIELLPGGVYTEGNGGYVTNEDVNVLSATGSALYFAKEM